MVDIETKVKYMVQPQSRGASAVQHLRTELRNGLVSDQEYSLVYRIYLRRLAEIEERAIDENWPLNTIEHVIVWH